jgi:cell division protein FtsN
MSQTRKRKTNKKPQQRRKARKQPKSGQQDYPGWMWMVFGLCIGLSVALAIYMKDRPPEETVAAIPPAIASALDDNNEVASVTPEPEEAPEQRFEFYSMLPNFEVIIPEEEPDVSQDKQHQTVEAPGNYVLQAGSFREFADADRRRAQLALQGIESRIQRVAIDDKTYHRVRIGPTRDLEELNVLRSRLREAKIDALRIRLGD